MATRVPVIEQDTDSDVVVPPAPVGAPSPVPEAQKKSHQYLMLLQMIAGSFSGAVTKTATAPLERIKIIFQIQGMSKNDLVKPKYTGILQTIALVSKEEGALALWKGNGANVLRVIPVYGLKFAFNDTFKTLVAGPGKKRLSTAELLWVGTLAGLFQTIITYPLETVRTRLSVGPEQGVQYKGIVDCVRQMVRTEGVGGLYKGLAATIISGAPYTGIQMTTYELLQRNTPGNRDSLVWQMLNGALAGLAAQTVMYPGDTVRRRMQNNGAGGAERVYKNTWHCTKMIWAQEGIRGYFRGAWTNTVRCLPGASIQFAAYELMKKALDC